MKAKELRERGLEDLQHMASDLKEDVFKLRFQHATGQLDDVSKLRQAKRKLARVHTLIREHELGIKKLTSIKDRNSPAAG
jgi:large subunit ribosomal protein L29